MKSPKYCFSLLALVLASVASAQEVPTPPKLEPIANLPDPAYNTPAAPPVEIEEGSEVNKRQDGEVQYEEYRNRQGRVYLVKVIPRIGAPYYIKNPSNGATTPDGRDVQQSTPSWIIKSW